MNDFDKPADLLIRTLRRNIKHVEVLDRWEIDLIVRLLDQEAERICSLWPGPSERSGQGSHRALLESTLSSTQSGGSS